MLSPHPFLTNPGASPDVDGMATTSQSLGTQQWTRGWPAEGHFSMVRWDFAGETGHTGWTKSQLQVERMVLFWSSRAILCGVSTPSIFPTATSSSRCSSPTLTHTGEKETGVCLLLPVLSHLTPVSDLWCWKSSTKSAKNLQLTNCSEQRTDKSLKQSFASF